MTKIIKVFHTHIEVFPYTRGEDEKLESKLSIWIDAEFRYDPIGYYIENDTLYIPRGFSIVELEKRFNTDAITCREPDDYKKYNKVIMTTDPRDDVQEDAVKFLCCEGEYEYNDKYSQQALILNTGLGKTYVTTHAIIKQRLNAVIITPLESLKTQWIKSFKEFSNIDESDLISINGKTGMLNVISGKTKGKIYFVNHQTIHSFANTHGWDKVREFFKSTKAGIKVYDEAHLMFRSTLFVDYFSNTYKTYYLTATFGRTDIKEDYLFRKLFSSVVRYGEDSTRKHVVYIPVLYRSHPSIENKIFVINAYGFSVPNFTKYALHMDDENTQLYTFYKIFDMANKLEGKILITVPTIDDTEYIKTKIQEEYKDLNKKISVINSRHSKEENAESKKADIICSTIKSCGTGIDIKGLRCLINLEPFSSNITANQLAGRLREYSPTEDTYFFDLIDIAFPNCEKQYTSKLPVMKKRCKAIKMYNI